MFMDNRILKFTESTTVTENNNINIELTDDEQMVPHLKKL